MTPAEIAGYIGAAAWLPQIATWIYRKLVLPVVTIVPDQYAEIGFTTYGPIFNLRMAFSAEKRDIIIDGVEILIRHSDGDTRTLRWTGLNETFSEITDSSGNRQVVSRDQVPIALKIGTYSLIEKFVRFQEPRYHEIDRPVLSALIAHFNFLKRSDPENYVAQALGCKEFFSVLETRQHSFWWKPGRYEVTLRLSSPKKLKVANSRYYFDVDSINIDRLKQNTDTIEADLKNVILSNAPDAKPQPINWNWTTVALRKLSSTAVQKK